MILKEGRGSNVKHLPLAFTEHGAIMAATVLNSPRAVQMSVYVVRAFVKLRELLISNKDLAKRLDELEARIIKQFGTYDQVISGILNTLRELTSPPSPKGTWDRIHGRSRQGVVGPQRKRCSPSTPRPLLASRARQQPRLRFSP